MQAVRTLADSEGTAAQHQKHMVRTLIRKGWTKNEIFYELQRVLGNDNISSPGSFAPEHSSFLAYTVALTPFVIGVSFILFRQTRRIRLERVVSAERLEQKLKFNRLKSSLESSKAIDPEFDIDQERKSNIDQDFKNEIFEKLKIKK
mmetsp:Transcript_10978/g.9716  ORF Transcript_10978/g.9716 Transcript_10978/m.9716 type:complete len:147 (+) Transcript_10978:137-577(+)